MTRVVDTSEFASLPNYGWLRAQGAEGVIPRMSGGPVNVDKLVEAQIAAAVAADVPPIAGYHYLYSWRSGAAQAEHAHRTAHALGLPFVFLDIEPVADGRKLKTDEPQEARLVAHAFLRRWLELEGRPCGVYGSAYYLEALDLDASLCGPLWVAHVGVATPHLPRPFERYVLHQYVHNEPGGQGKSKVDWNRTDLTLAELLGELRPREDFANNAEGPPVLQRSGG